MLNKEFLKNPFVLSSSLLSKNSIFDKYVKLTNAYLYLNDDTKYIEYEQQNSKIILIGYVLDIRDGKKSTNIILKELLKLYLNSNLEKFYSTLDYINGRFVIILSDENDTRLYTDATSMLPIFYYEEKIFSSHEIIVKEIIKEEYDLELDTSEYGMKNFLDYTNTENVYKFNPNHYFTFKDKEFKRYFPRENYKIQNLETVINNTRCYYATQLNWLTENYKKIYVSLTGGFDSKLSLALIKPIVTQVEFFTYMYKYKNHTKYDSLNSFHKIYYKDKVIVDNLVYNFNLKHKYFYFNDYEVPKEYINELGKHVSSDHSYKLSYLTKKEFESDSVHVKSTLYELAKLPYNEKSDMRIVDSWIIQAMRKWAPKNIQNDSEKLKEMYRLYKKRNLVNEIIKLEYNLPLMVYWEFRMGNWHSSLTQETDFLIDTFIFINNRYMLNQLISLSKEDRMEKKYLTSIVKEYWPALNYFKANSFDTLEDKID